MNTSGCSDSRMTTCLAAYSDADNEFNLALCSHLLFTYTEQLSPDFHRAAIAEMCRVAGEVRIFPLLDIGGRKSAHVEPIALDLNKNGYKVKFVKVPYEFQKGANVAMCVFI